MVQPIKQGCDGDFSLYLVKNKNKNEIEVNVQRNGQNALLLRLLPGKEKIKTSEIYKISMQTYW